MRPKVQSETPEMKAERVRAERDNLRSTQDVLRQRTTSVRRMMRPRVSIATGRAVSSQPLGY